MKRETSLARTTCPKTMVKSLGTACATKLLPLLLLLLALPAVVQAQFTFTTNNGTITITKYTGPGGDVTIPDTTNGYPVTSIGYGAFGCSSSLTNITIPNSVTSIGDSAFSDCWSLTAIYFQGNAPSLGLYELVFESNATVYYLPGTTGWDKWVSHPPAVLWNPQAQNLGVRTNGFGFTITGSSNLVIVVEACTNLANPAWAAVGTNTLTGGSSYFSDPQWMNYPARFYRLRSP